jgi:hypothetical protein
MKIWYRSRWSLMVGVCYLCQAGCLGLLQRELEVLFRPEANPALIYDSILVERFGLAILGLFN